MILKIYIFTLLLSLPYCFLKKPKGRPLKKEVSKIIKSKFKNGSVYKNLQISKDKRIIDYLLLTSSGLLPIFILDLNGIKEIIIKNNKIIGIDKDRKVINLTLFYNNIVLSYNSFSSYLKSLKAVLPKEAILRDPIIVVNRGIKTRQKKIFKNLNKDLDLGEPELEKEKLYDLETELLNLGKKIC